MQQRDKTQNQVAQPTWDKKPISSFHYSTHSKHMQRRHCWCRPENLIIKHLVDCIIVSLGDKKIALQCRSLLHFFNGRMCSCVKWDFSLKQLTSFRVLGETSSDVTDDHSAADFAAFFTDKIDSVCASTLHNAAVRLSLQCDIDARYLAGGYYRRGRKADRFCTE